MREKDRYSSRGLEVLEDPDPVSGYYVTRIENGLHLSHSQPAKPREPVYRALIRADGIH